MAYFQNHQYDAILCKNHPVGANAKPQSILAFQFFDLIGKTCRISGVLINLGKNLLRLLPGDARQLL